MSETLSFNRAPFGWIAFAAGALALVIVLFHFASGPLAPQQTLGVTLGEMAGEMKDSAIRSLKGEDQPAPVTSSWDIDRVLKTVATVLAGTAVVLGLVSLLRKEPYRAGSFAITLGVGAVVFQFFVWAILLVCGVFIIVAFMHNIGDFFGGIGL